LELENFLLKLLDLIIHQEVPKLKLFSQQDLVDKTMAQQPKVNSKFSGLVLNSRTNALNCYDVLIGVAIYMVIVTYVYAISFHQSQ